MPLTFSEEPGGGPRSYPETPESRLASFVLSIIEKAGYPLPKVVPTFTDNSEIAMHWDVYGKPWLYFKDGAILARSSRREEAAYLTPFTVTDFLQSFIHI